MPAINPLPTPPSRNDPANFSDRADAFLAALPAYTSEANALLEDVHTSRDTALQVKNDLLAVGLADVEVNAESAAASAASALASKNAAQAAQDDIHSNWQARLDSAAASAATATSKADIATVQANNAAASASSASASATTASGKADVATAQANAATSAKTAAEAARDAAVLASGLYNTAAAGIAATASGKIFFVKTADVQVYDTYLNNAGVANLIGQLSIANGQVFGGNISSDYAYVIQNDLMSVVFGIKPDGTVAVLSLEAGDINGADLSNLNALELIERDKISDFVHYIADSFGALAFGVKSDGSVAVDDLTAGDVVADSLTTPAADVTALTVNTINGATLDELLTTGVIRDNGSYTAEINFINNTGQSLGEGSTPPAEITTAQEYDSVGFPAGSSSPAAFLPLTTGNCAEGGRGENPMFGACGFIKELILKEEGITYTQHSYQLAACSNATGGSNIAGISKGTTDYTNAMAQVQAGYNLAQTAGKIFKHQANLFTQGEANGTTDRVTYKNALKQLASDYNADSKAITGQSDDVVTICYQVSTDPVTSSSVALAQMDAHDESALVTVATPIYFMEYSDGVHITANSSKWLGAYYGLAYKRVKVDGLAFEPLRPLSTTKQGRILSVKFKVPRAPLVLDTNMVQQQTNYGFTLVDSSGNSLPISSVSVIENDTVKIVAANTIPAGAKLRYAMNNATFSSGGYTRGAGNLRDSQGDRIVYSAINKPMHNWCVIFEINV